MSDEAIEFALSQQCERCGARVGQECIHEVSGVPLIDSVAGAPVHAMRTRQR